MSKRGSKPAGLVPIEKVAVRLPGIEGRGRAMSAQARHHFTLLRQVNQLIEAGEAEPDLGFMARLMALCSLPRTNPRQRTQYVRQNGPYTLVMQAGGVPARLPYGNIPRLLLAWVCTEAVRTQRRELVLGRSLYEFMRHLGMDDRSGGVNGQRTRLRNQMTRLFHCTVQLMRSDGDHEVTVSSLIADKSEYWWNAAEGPDRPGLFDSTIRLGEEFFNEVIEHPVPLDMNILRALKRSPLGLDLYVWLVYRTFTLTAPITLTWRQLFRQFGADPSKASNKKSVSRFRDSVLREIKKLNARGRTWNTGRSRAGSSSSPVRLASLPLLSFVSSSRSRRLVGHRVERAGRDHRLAITGAGAATGQPVSP